jgi:hypothetical protein
MDTADNATKTTLLGNLKVDQGSIKDIESKLSSLNYQAREIKAATPATTAPASHAASDLWTDAPHNAENTLKKFLKAEDGKIEDVESKLGRLANYEAGQIQAATAAINAPGAHSVSELYSEPASALHSAGWIGATVAVVGSVGLLAVGVVIAKKERISQFFEKCNTADAVVVLPGPYGRSDYSAI